MLEIYKDTNIYIVSPAGVASGGPEALHQLAYDLKVVFKLGNVFMYYLPVNSVSPVHDFYKHYHIDCLNEIKDDKKNILIIPEIYTKEFIKFKNIQKAVWWLSIDHYFLSSPSFIKSKINLLIRDFGRGYYVFFNRKSVKDYKHFAQSNYAINFLKKRKVDAMCLFESINQKYLDCGKEFIKEDIVVYNPKKGFKFTKKLIKFCNGIKFVPIENMSQSQVEILLKSAKVYIDFGYHPGRDRIPREAAILECCVITGKRGSAKFFNDVSIPPNYKFSGKRSDLLSIRSRIKDCFENYDIEIKKFAEYRDIIKNERLKYLSQIKNIFNFKQ